MSNTITSISPITGKEIISRELSSFETPIQKSVIAFNQWRLIPLSKRKEVVSSFLDALASMEEDIATELTTEMGRPIKFTPSEIKTCVMRGRYMLSLADELDQVDVDKISPPSKGIKRFIRKEPLGPILVISAWNYPYLITINSVVPGILAGNSILLKPSPQTMLAAERFQKALSTALQKHDLADLSDKLLQVVYAGTLEQVSTMVSNEKVALICFTGSVEGGRAVQKAARERFIPVGLELGGKDPAYVRADADVTFSAVEIADGAMFNSGQSCCSIERVYVHESVYDEFVSKIVEEVKSLKLGDPFDTSTSLGPVISQRSADSIRGQVKEAVGQGAEALVPIFEKDDGKSTFLTPQVLVKVDHSMKVMTEETFGPVVGIMKVSSDEEAIKLMNDSPFGLTASIWTRNEDEGLNLLEKVEAGTVFLNRADYPDPALAWTGWKDSGRGCTLSKFGFDAFVKLKSYHLKSSS